MQKKIIAALVAILMAIVPAAMIMTDSADATSGEANGTYSVYVNNGQTCNSKIVNAYDAAQAVEKAFAQDGDIIVDKYTPASDANPYVTYNWNTYGNITKYMGIENTTENVWNAFVLVGSNLIKVENDDCLGSYKCFSDYTADHRTANIYLYYGSSSVDAVDVIMSFAGTSNLVAKSLITQVSGDAYAVTFCLKIQNQAYNATVSGDLMGLYNTPLTNDTLKSNGVYVKGYGSDCYLALKNAITSANISATETAPGVGYNAYSWMDTMFGLGTVEIPAEPYSTWVYWSILDSSTAMGDTSDHWADFVLGAYSPLASAGAPFVDNSFALIYQ